MVSVSCYRDEEENAGDITTWSGMTGQKKLAHPRRYLFRKISLGNMRRNSLIGGGLSDETPTQMGVVDRKS